MRWIIALLLTILAWPLLAVIDAGLWCCGGKRWRDLRKESNEGVRRVWRSRK